MTEEQRARGQEGKPVNAAKQLGSYAAKSEDRKVASRSALQCRQENLMSGWQSRPTDISFDCANEIISTDNSETLQAQQTDKNLSTLQPFNCSTDNDLPSHLPTFPPFGFFNIYKPVGMTSLDVVAVLRKTLKIKQIGHTGTLDPFAEGVLPIAIGKATRLIEYLPDDKEYLATVQFGKSTNTYDIEGETTFESNKKVSEQEIIEKLKDFEGEIEQFPPIFSAIKVKGKKLYEYARKGEKVEIQPRKVVIYDIELKSFDFELQQAQILIKCSKGTYIRSIANDLGEKSGCGGHLIRLIRTQAGKFRVEDSVKLKMESGKFFIVESGKLKVESLLSNNETSQSSQSDKLAHPPLETLPSPNFQWTFGREVRSKSLISGWGSVNDKNPSNDNSTPSLTLPLGEGTCHDSLSTFDFPLSTFHFQLINPPDVLDLPIVEIDNKDLEKIKNGISININSEKLNNFQLSTFNFQPDMNSSQFTVHCSQNILLVYNKEKICAVGQIENNKIKLKKVFL